MSIKKDKYFVRIANNLAKNSLNLTGPNPSVGALIVKNDKVISFGSTSFSGRPHAEDNALKKLSKKNKKNSTIYISLEPCSHYGKTSPCVDKIINSKIQRVVYSINDIDPRTSGKSYKILKSKKIYVKKNLLKNYAKSIYKNYIFSKKNNKPYIYGKLAISKDRYLKDKKNFYMTNKLSLKTTHILRSRVNCILTTAKTINDDDPKLNCRLEGLEMFTPNVAVIDKSLKVKKNSFIIKNAKNNKTILFYNKKNTDKLNFLKSKKVITIHIPLFNNRLNLNITLKKLYNYELSSVLVECGKSLMSSLINNNFINEFYLFETPIRLKKRGILKMKNIKSDLSKKFNCVKINETFLDKDNLIHYY